MRGLWDITQAYTIDSPDIMAHPDAFLMPHQLLMLCWWNRSADHIGSLTYLYPYLNLLPCTVGHQAILYGAAETPKARLMHWLRYLGVFIYCVFLGVLIARFVYSIYAGVTGALPLWKR